MIADIGLIVASYVVFRTAESLLNLAPGGPLAKLPVGAQIVLGILGTFLIIVTVSLAVDIVGSGTRMTEALDEIPTW